MDDHIVEYVPQSFPKSDSDDSEESEEDLEQEGEEDLEQEGEEDQEQECEDDPEQDCEEDLEQEGEDDPEQECEEDQEQECEEDQEQECEEDQEQECEEDSEQECEEDSEQECEEDQEQECEEQECEEDPEQECEGHPEQEFEEQECEEDQGQECEEDQEQECEEDPDEELEEYQDGGSEEETPEDELEEDQVLGSGEDPEEESSAELSEELAEEPSESVSPDADVSKESATKPPSHGEIDGNDHPSGSNDNRLKEACKVEPDVAKQQERTGSSGKRRRSRWDEEDGRTDLGNETGKRRKTRWSTEVSDLKMLGPIQLPDCVKGLDVNNMDPKIQKLKRRLSSLNRQLFNSELQDDSPEMKRLAAHRRGVISTLINNNAIFRAVTSDTPPPKLFKKLYIPVKEYPAYNFIGIIIGPRGNTQKKLEQETGARIVLRGKGSAKEPGKRVDKSDNEDIHVLIEADNQKSLDAAVEKVEKLLIPVDDGMNDHKRAQLVELAKLKGNTGNACSVCKQVGHKDYACPCQHSTFKTVITCVKCGSFFHTSSTCPVLIPNTKCKPNRETSNTSLYVGYLPQGVDEIRLKELFSPFGKITEVTIIVDRNTGQSKGYGFVKFESSIHAASAATHMNGLRLEGKFLAVRLAGQPPPPGPLSQLPIHPGQPPPPGPLSQLPIHPGQPPPPGPLSQLPIHPGQPPPPGPLNQLPIHPGQPAGICANVPSHLRHLPLYPGPAAAAISPNALNQRPLPEPPGYMLPESKSSFQEGLGSSSSSILSGNFNRFVGSTTMDILPPVVSSHASSQHASSFDSYYSRYPNQIPLSSPSLMSQLIGGQDYPGPQFLSSYTPRST